MGTVYYGAYDQDMTPIGLFRVITDDQAKTLDMEYMNAQGAWVNDPTVIDELREPGVEVIQASDVPDFADALVDASVRSASALSSRDAPKMLRGPENSSADRSSD